MMGFHQKEERKIFKKDNLAHVSIQGEGEPSQYIQNRKEEQPRPKRAHCKSKIQCISTHKVSDKNQKTVQSTAVDITSF